MGIRETLGVGRTTKIKLIDRQIRRIEEEIEILTKNAINSDDKDVLEEMASKIARIGITTPTYLRSNQNYKNAIASIESALSSIRMISDKSPFAELKPVLTNLLDALKEGFQLNLRGNLIAYVSAILTDKGNKQNKRKR